MACWIRNLCAEISKLKIVLKPSEDPPVEIPLIEQKPQKPANRKPRTDEQKAFASQRKKEWWEKKRQEQSKTSPDADDSKQKP